MKIFFKYFLNSSIVLTLASPTHAMNKVKTMDNLFHMAEIEFLDTDLSKAVASYTNITQLALDEIWPLETRRKIFQAHFRMGQLEKDKQPYWITKAIEFAPDLQPDLEITPKNLCELFSELSSKKTLISIDDDFSNSAPDHKILINSSQDIKKVSPSKLYRLDFIKPGAESITYYVKGREINSFDLNQKLAAEKRRDEERMAAVKSQPRLAKSLPVKLTPDSKLSDSMVLASFNPNQQVNSELQGSRYDGSSQTKLRKAKKRRRLWLYVGSAIVGVTLGAVLMSQNSGSPNTYEPANPQGF